MLAACIIMDQMTDCIWQIERAERVINPPLPASGEEHALRWLGIYGSDKLSQTCCNSGGFISAIVTIN